MICLDEFGPLNLQPQPGGKAWAPRAKPQTDPRHLHPPARRPPPALRASTSAPTALRARSTSARPASSSSPSAATSAPATRPRSRLAFMLDNFSPHKGDQVRDWAAGQQRRARLHAPLRLLAQPDRGAVQRPALLLPRRHRPPRPRHPGPADRRYIDWRNDHRDDPKLRHLTRRELARKAARPNTANVA